MSPLAGRPLADRWMGGLDRRDRTLLIVCGLLIVTIIVAIAIFSPPGKGQEATTPFSYSTDRHGAKAAFELLTKAGHKVERQNAPLSEIIDRVDQHTTLVIAEPYLQYVLDNRDVLKQALDRGARVLVTGASGALLVPGNALDQRTQMQADCQAEPNGFGDIANSGKVEMGPRSIGNAISHCSGWNTPAMAAPSLLPILPAREKWFGGQVPFPWRTRALCAQTTWSFS